MALTGVPVAVGLPGSDQIGVCSGTSPRMVGSGCGGRLWPGGLQRDSADTGGVTSLSL